MYMYRELCLEPGTEKGYKGPVGKGDTTLGKRET